MPAADARGRRERDAQPEACQRCSSGRSLSRSVLNPLPDLPEERDCETLRVAGSPVRCGFITLPTTGLNILSSTRITSQWRASFFYRRRRAAEASRDGTCQDSQLALIAKAGVVWAVATVDADFIVHGIERIVLPGPPCSLHKHLPERVSGHCWHFPSEQGDSTTLPATSEWITGRNDIAALAPFLERQMIYSHWERSIVEVAESTHIILDDAFSRRAAAARV
eukprot:jgi/Tetstr1/443244/TSEL_031281.t3